MLMLIQKGDTSYLKEYGSEIKVIIRYDEWNKILDSLCSNTLVKTDIMKVN